MVKLIAPSLNCWQSFLSALLEVDIHSASECSTRNDDWHERTQAWLGANFGLFYIEISPEAVTGIPEGMLVGAHVHGAKAAHIVIAKAKQWINGVTINHRFVVEHDPSGQWRKGLSLSPKRIILLCKLFQ